MDVVESLTRKARAWGGAGPPLPEVELLGAGMPPPPPPEPEPDLSEPGLLLGPGGGPAAGLAGTDLSDGREVEDDILWTVECGCSATSRLGDRYLTCWMVGLLMRVDILSRYLLFQCLLNS